ncbi:MAG: aromatic ring-hydroxylating dioxygenase subunit alpha [Paracoccaceae bacterium]
MDRQTELALLDELMGLSARKSAYLDEDVTYSDVAHYTDSAHFEAEMQHVFRRYPLMVAHNSELPDPGSFLRRDTARQPMLITRDSDGQVHAFINVCRHRGARLVDETQGCKHVFSCPYHAWTWSNKGDLRGIPHRKQGFPDIDRSDYGLTRLTCAERSGWIWVVPDPSADVDIDAHLAPLDSDLRWLDMEGMVIAEQDTLVCNANWKLLVEGGIEAYHFRVAHANTIGPFFPDNLSSYQMFDRHMRSVLPRISLETLGERDREDWNIRNEANIVYSLFPTSQWLVQQDHLVWIHMNPLAADKSHLTLATLVPASEKGRKEHWKRNHQITMTTLQEDFELGEGIQAGMATGANTRLTFGRYEGALNAFAKAVQSALPA